MTRLLHILVCLLTVCLLPPVAAPAAKTKAVKMKPAFSEQTSATIRPLAVLGEMKHWSNPDYTRISPELDRDVTWEAHQIDKDVVLVIGLKLRELFKDELGLDVVMTRSTDVFIPLEERTAIANKVNADLFLSVHANAAPNRNAFGIETYYLNLAKTEKAAQSWPPRKTAPRWRRSACCRRS